MLKAVYDTNVIVSAHLKAESWPAIISSLALQDKVKLFVYEEILKEYQEVLLREKFRLDPEKIKKSMTLLKRHSVFVKSKTSLAATLDPDDDKFLERALEAGANFLITGNKKHFPKSELKGIKIVSPIEFGYYFMMDLVKTKRELDS